MTARIDRLGKLLPVLVALLVVALTVVGCRRAGLPEQTRVQADRLDKRITGLLAAVDNRQEALAGLIPADLQKYADREDWAASYPRARQALSAARTDFNNKAKPVLQRDDPKDNDALARILVGLNAQVDAGEATLLFPERRLEALKDARDNGPALLRTASARAMQLPDRIALPVRGAERAKPTYPHKREDLSRRIAALRSHVASANAGVVSMRRELAKPEPDLGVFADGKAAVDSADTATIRGGQDLSSRVSQLGRSYTKRLLDMRADHIAEFRGLTWDEWREGESRVLLSPVTVSPSQAEQLVAFERREYSLSEIRLYGASVERSLRSRSTFWLHDLDVRFLHRYEVEENGRISRTNWLEVNEDVFLANTDNLGMDLVVKPFGMYEDETIHVASPPGMGYVGNPLYGAWILYTGGRYWRWRNRYSYLDRYRYTYDDWDFWRKGYRNKRPWYGSRYGNGGAGGGVGAVRFGTWSATTRNYYAATDFARTTGFNRQAFSARGLGPLARGGGPGFRGK